LSDILSQIIDSITEHEGTGKTSWCPHAAFPKL
jgi:hypothetical protein